MKESVRKRETSVDQQRLTFAELQKGLWFVAEGGGTDHELEQKLEQE